MHKSEAWAVEIIDEDGYFIHDVFETESVAKVEAEKLDGRVIYYPNFDWEDLRTPFNA